MKKRLPIILSFALFCSTIYAQDSPDDTPKTKDKRNCGTMEYMEQEKLLDPTLELRLQQMEEYTQQWIKENPDGKNDKVVITVPVIVHLVYANSSQNISDARIQEQIDVLNRDFSGANTHSMGAFGSNLKSNTELQFCLAKRTPSGASSTGIERRQTTVSSFSTNNNVKHYSTGGLNQWDPHKYMNIWVCNLGGGLLGYGEFPTSNLSSNYGVVISYKYFGLTGATYPYNQGGTATHEIGHCFNLFHIWGDDGGSCTGSDNCNDTPNQANSNWGCPSQSVKTDNCTTTSPGIMYMNFMDYSDDACYANFTPSQKNRIQSCFGTSGPLKNLVNSDGCIQGVGIDELENITNVNIYPNPSKDLINVIFDIANTDDIVITVNNMVGDVIAKIEKQSVSSVNIPIDLSEQSAGIYFVNIQSSKQTITSKLSLIK